MGSQRLSVVVPNSPVTTGELSTAWVFRCIPDTVTHSVVLLLENLVQLGAWFLGV